MKISEQDLVNRFEELTLKIEKTTAEDKFQNQSDIKIIEAEVMKLLDIVKNQPPTIAKAMQPYIVAMIQKLDELEKTIKQKCA